MFVEETIGRFYFVQGLLDQFPRFAFMAAKLTRMPSVGLAQMVQGITRRFMRVDEFLDHQILGERPAGEEARRAGRRAR